MKKGFTLLELIVVIIIIGILATLGFTQFTGMIEKARRAEAMSNLGAMRSIAMAWNQEGGHATDYPATGDLIGLLGTGFAAGGCNTTYYFQYSMDGTTGTGTADRCATGSGKSPGGDAADNLTLTVDGVKGGTVFW